MDAVYAVFVILLASATVITLLNVSQQSNTAPMYLSRIARDIHDTNQSMNGNLDPEDINWVKINDCAGSDQVGSHEAVAYNGSGDLKTVRTEVCPR